jgi:hypothetical protein
MIHEKTIGRRHIQEKEFIERLETGKRTLAVSPVADRSEDE